LASYALSLASATACSLARTSLNANGIAAITNPAATPANTLAWDAAGCTPDIARGVAICRRSTASVETRGDDDARDDALDDVARASRRLAPAFGRARVVFVAFVVEFFAGGEKDADASSGRCRRSRAHRAE
tara:strand:- start:21621 stop:22013 length:393 start_codon:yes stop_codon:yes gene_type:complete